MELDIWDLIGWYWHRMEAEENPERKAELQYYVDKLTMAFINERVVSY